MRLTRMPFLGTVLCVSVVLAGQTNVVESAVGVMSSEVSGQVRDVCGRVIPGAIVALGNESGKSFRVGRSHVSQWLATPARWILAVQFRGLAPYVQSDLDLQPDEPQVIKISLRPR